MPAIRWPPPLPRGAEALAGKGGRLGRRSGRPRAALRPSVALQVLPAAGALERKPVRTSRSDPATARLKNGAAAREGSPHRGH